MNIIQCKMCLKPFQSRGGKICGSCLQNIEEEFTKIKDYLYEHPECDGVAELVEATGVDKEIILYLIREDRIVVNGAPSGGGRRCTVCQRSISAGSMCDDCKTSLSKTLKSTLPPPPKKERSRDSKAPKMHLDHSRE